MIDGMAAVVVMVVWSVVIGLVVGALMIRDLRGPRNRRRLKGLLMPAVLALGALGLVACGSRYDEPAEPAKPSARQRLQAVDVHRFCDDEYGNLVYVYAGHKAGGVAVLRSAC